MSIREVSNLYGTTEEVILELVSRGIITIDESDDTLNYDELCDKDSEIEETIMEIMIDMHYARPSFVS